MTFTLAPDRLPAKLKSFLIPRKEWCREYEKEFESAKIDEIAKVRIGEAHVFKTCANMGDIYRLQKAEKVRKLVASYGMEDLFEIPQKRLSIKKGIPTIVAQKISLTEGTLNPKALEGIARLIFDAELTNLHKYASTLDGKVAIIDTEAKTRFIKKWWQATPLALFHDPLIARTTRSLVSTTLLKESIDENLRAHIEEVENRNVLFCALFTLLKLALCGAAIYLFYGTIVVPSLVTLKAITLLAQFGLTLSVWIGDSPAWAQTIRQHEDQWIRSLYTWTPSLRETELL